MRRLWKKGVAGDEDGVGPLARKRCEGSVDLAAGAGFVGVDLHSPGASGRFHVSQRRFHRRGIGRIDEHGHTGGPGHQLTQYLQPLCRQLVIEKIDAGQISTRPGETGDKAKLDRVFADDENDGDRRGCRLGRQRLTDTAQRDDDCDSPAHQFGRQRRQPIRLTLGPAVFDHGVLAFDMAGVFQALAKSA
jgi:hypothetical protein